MPQILLLAMMIRYEHIRRHVEAGRFAGVDDMQELVLIVLIDSPDSGALDALRIPIVEAASCTELWWPEMCHVYGLDIATASIDDLIDASI